MAPLGQIADLSYETYFQRRKFVNRTIGLTPIGFVSSQFTENVPPEEMRRVPAQIVIEPEFEPGLMGLQPGQDIQVLFYFNKVHSEDIQLHLHPRHNPANPLAGVFATRTPLRPNQIGATVVCIERIEGKVLTVTGIDAQDGTPVLDIKPYVPYFDSSTAQQQFAVREVTSLDEARAMIDVIDAEIIRLFGNRAGFVKQVARFKNRPEDVPAPERYAAVMQTRRQMAEAAGLNPDIIEGMYKLLVDNFIKEEIEIIQQRGGGN